MSNINIYEDLSMYVDIGATGLYACDFTRMDFNKICVINILILCFKYKKISCSPNQLFASES